MDFLLSAWLFLFSQTIHIQKDTVTVYDTVRTAVQREFNGEADLALSIFQCESGLRPASVGDHGSSIGIAQIYLPAHAGKIPALDKKAWLKDFQNNIKLAKKIRDKSGWSAWTCYKTGAYLAYLK